MKKLIPIFLAYLSSFIVSNAQDLILTNGRIFTSDTAQLYVEALAVKDGRITAIGKTADIEKLTTKSTQRIDLQGMLVVPGFNDAHNHLTGGFNFYRIALEGMNPTWQAVQDSITKVVQKLPKGHWIEATIGPSIANSPETNRFILDKIAPHHPVRLLSWWGHVGLFNALAMKELGVSEAQSNPKGGFYERMTDGKTLTGKAFEKNAYHPHTALAKFDALRDDNAMIAELRGYTQALLRAGVTSYQNMCTYTSAEEYARIWKKVGLPFRLRLIRWGDVNTDGSLHIPSKNLPKYDKDLPLLTVSGTKWLLDGTPIEGGSEQFDAHSNRPNWYGRANYTKAEIEKMCREAIARHDQLHFHAVGDKTLSKLLDLLEEINIDWKALRPRIEHGDGIDYKPEMLEKAKKLGVVIVQNPTHFAPMEGIEAKTEPKGVAAFRSLLTQTIPLAIGSDGPFNPYLNIMFAVTHPLRPSEAITREQAVIAYTRTSAYAEMEEQHKGTLTVGKVADLAVLSQNIFKVPLQRLVQTESILTMVNGKVVYDAGVLK
jgi:predicted amidohydrolase YtcJ